MTYTDAKEFVDWLFIRLSEEPELNRALIEMHPIYRGKLEREILEKLREEEC
jgi:hypothetical protein